MGFGDANDEVARKTLVMFFLIDVSGSMWGEKIGCVNTTMAELLPEMRDISDNNADAVIKLAVMQFSDSARWETQFPVDFEDYTWNDLEADGPTSLGEACELLNEKLDKNEFLSDKVGNLAPVIILLSDGGPTDDFYSGLSVLKNNRWFRHAIKAAIGIGDDYDEQVLADFTGNRELVIKAENSEMLKRMIKFVSVKSSTRASSHNIDTNTEAGAEAAQNQLANDIQEALEEAEDDGVTEIPGFI